MPVRVFWFGRCLTFNRDSVNKLTKTLLPEICKIDAMYPHILPKFWMIFCNITLPYATSIFLELHRHSSSGKYKTTNKNWIQTYVHIWWTYFDGRTHPSHWCEDYITISSDVLKQYLLVVPTDMTSFQVSPFYRMECFRKYGYILSHV